MDTKEEAMRTTINKILDNIHPAVMPRKIDKLINLIRHMHEVEDKELLRECYIDRGIDLITLTCKYNKKTHLNYILHQSHIVHYLTSDSTALKSKEDAFYYAMLSNQFEVLEILYDYWSGDLHWLGHKKEYNEFDLENLNRLNESLTNALRKYEEYILKIKRKVNLQHMFNIQSLMAFNCFQRNLYTKLNELKTNITTSEDGREDTIRIHETEAIKSMILTMFDIDEKHSKKGEHMIEESVFEVTNEIKELLTDTSTLFHRARMYVIYDVFFRKMDYNFCLLVLDNIHLLKLRLALPDYSYQKLENKLYHFIYHTSSKWSLYFPRRKRNQTHNFLGKFKEKLCMLSFTQDASKEESAFHIIYLERRDFEAALKSFKDELLHRNIEENIRTRQYKLPNEDINSLMFLPNLRDDYSLKRISQHISQLYSINVKYENKYVFLLIERSLQVVGEFLKSTDESLHLQPSTEALVKAEISVEIVNDLKTLRNMLSHTKNAELLKRIEVETNRSDIFHRILKELIYFKKKIDEVINICKPFVERDLIRNAMSIICDRKDEMPDKAKMYVHVLKVIACMPHNFIRENFEKNFFKNTWAPLGFSESLMKETITLAVHSEKLEFKLTETTKKIFKNVIKKFPFYRQKLKASFKIIMTCKQKWQKKCEALKSKSSTVNFLDYPNEEDVNKIKSHAKTLGLGDEFLIELGECPSLFSLTENHWHFIANLLDFIVNKSRIFNDTIEELKWSIFTHRLRELNDCNYKSNETDEILNHYLDLMDSKLSEFTKLKLKQKKFIKDADKLPKFTGIEELTHKLITANFLTQDEKTHIINVTSKIEVNGKNNKTAVDKIINKIKNDIAIPKKDFTYFVNVTKLNLKTQKVLMNLVMGYKRDALLPQCLSKRISLLEEITKKESKEQLVNRYKSDKTFRVLLEVLLFDIFAALEGNRNDEISKKSSKLLTEINLRNVLTHGNALLEVVGHVLDSNDLATELVTKALAFIQDKKSINALCTLSDLGVDFSELNEETMTPNQKELLNEFKKSVKWKDFLQLVTGYKQAVYEKRKNALVVDEKSLDLLKAVNKKDSLLVQDKINEGANVNFIDKHNKAIVHYAAMRGDINTMGILLKNGADVNIRNKENNLTALHYSAMNKFAEAVNYLLEHGADCFALDDRGRTPVFWAGQRNHENVCRILVRAMKRQEYI